MHCVKKVTDDLYWIGGSDRRLALFENVYPIPRGVSYNSYVLLDEKTVLLDTVDASISGLFFENLEYVLNGRTLDYLIVNHMEPDHCAVYIVIGAVILILCLIVAIIALVRKRKFAALPDSKKVEKLFFAGRKKLCGRNFSDHTPSFPRA